VGSDNEN